MEYIRVTILSILLSGGFFSFAFSNPQSNYFQISIVNDPSNSMSIERVKDLIESNSKLLILSDSMHGSFNSDATYWLYLQPLEVNDYQEYVLSFKAWVSLLEVYPSPYSTASGRGGRLVPRRLKTLPGSSVVLNPGINGFLVKVQDRLHSEANIKDISILPSLTFHEDKENYNLEQGFFQGLLWLMLLYNLILYFFAKKRLHLFYVIYILLNSLYLFFLNGYSEIYLFPDNARLNFIFIPFQLIGVFFYLMFLRTALLNHCTTYTTAIDQKFLPFIYIILFANLAVGSTFFFWENIFNKSFNTINLINSIIGICIYMRFYKGSDSFMRTVIFGSAALIVFGLISILWILLEIPTKNLFYEVGLLSELLLLTYALNKQYFEEKYKAGLMKYQLERELDNKNRELVYKAMQLSAKEEAFASVKEKIQQIGNTNHSVSKSSALNIQSENIKNKNYLLTILSDIDLYQKQDSWDDFERYFTQVHPDFFIKLKEKYHVLSRNDLRLCALIKLNLSTKEISNVTKISLEGIKKSKYRLKKKMNGTSDESLYDFIQSH